MRKAVVQIFCISNTVTSSTFHHDKKHVLYALLTASDDCDFFGESTSLHAKGNKQIVLDMNI